MREDRSRVPLPHGYKKSEFIHRVSLTPYPSSLTPAPRAQCPSNWLDLSWLAQVASTRSDIKKNHLSFTQIILNLSYDLLGEIVSFSTAFSRWDLC